MKEGRIVLAEDDARVRHALYDLLVAWGYQVASARDGIEALEKVAQFDPAVVVSDMRMPRMNGAELVRILRAKNPALKFILYSGMRLDEGDIVDLADVCFIQKPFDPDRLREEVSRCLAPPTEFESRSRGRAGPQEGAK